MSKCKIAIIVFLAMFLVAGPLVLADDSVPDEAAVRQQVEALIQNSPGHRATLGMLQGTMALSISFGAPAWNAGDHDACCRFYVKTGESLCAAFAAQDAATGPARQRLDDLKTALDRVHNSADSDANAWTMRFVFDRTTVAADTEAFGCVRLLALGGQCFARSQFQDAATAYTAATVALRELDGQPLEQIPAECRFAPLALGEALFGQKQYAQAAAAVQEGLHFCPEWASSKADIRKQFGDAAVYELLFDDLRDDAASHPDDAGLQFLFGYQLYFTERRVAARGFFEKALKLDPDNAGAKRLLQEYDPAHHDDSPPSDTPPSAPAHPARGNL